MALIDQVREGQIISHAVELPQPDGSQEAERFLETAPDVQLPVSVVIPAYNEEVAVGAQIAAVRNVLNDHQIAHEIIVIDDGSDDRTAEAAVQALARVLQHPLNRGYGAALKTGIAAARYDLIAIIDADGTYPAAVIPELLTRATEYDMVVGARTRANVQIPLVRRPAKWFLRMLAGYLAGQAIPDLNSGLRIMRKSAVERFEYILPAGFSFTTTITLALLCNDYLVFYHPVEYYHRVGQSKIRPIDAYHFFLLILRTIVYFNPLKVFLPLGAVLFFTGLSKFIYDIFLENLSETAIFGFLGAFIIWAMGLLSDQIARVGLAVRSK